MITDFTYNMNNIFKKEPPISGGSFFQSKQNLKARESVISSNLISKKLNESIKSYLKSENFTYNFYWLLQQQADYFTSIVSFRFNTKKLTEAIYKVIRCGVIYGKSAVYVTASGDLWPLYINEVRYDEISGDPIYLSASLVDNVFSQKTLAPMKNKWMIFNKPEQFNNIYIFNSSSTGFGGLIRWTPFLKQLENILKMMYTHSYSFLKTVLYDVKDLNFVEKELELFFSCENPFLVNLGDENLMRNKFKEFNFTETDKTNFFDYLNQFLNTYYSLIGRRFNVDFKKERNISGEVEASQDNFDILQNELKQYIILLLEWVSMKVGVSYAI